MLGLIGLRASKFGNDSDSGHGAQPMLQPSRNSDQLQNGTESFREDADSISSLQSRVRSMLIHKHHDHGTK